MRFLANGPNIPDSLLEKRDAGRVVFLCGAGVSLPSGMPTFAELTKFVIDKLKPSNKSNVMEAWEPWTRKKPPAPKTPLDQIFQLLNEEFGRDQVNEYVTARLSQSNSDKPGFDPHEIISRISTNQAGQPQIVTTNFDLLFEKTKACGSIKKFLPPSFPEIRHDQPATGITYLHGRLVDEPNQSPDYVLSSADFGKAYLAAGWATSFVRALLENYTVVLLGYQAEDFAIKYLLQGLKLSNRSSHSNLYAFDRGEQEQIEVKWRDRGVTAIGYPGEGQDHGSLWNSLEAWAKRADNPRKWREDVIELAQRGPSNLQPHERGMVTHLVRTVTGAKLFANSTPPITPEWLCVFDASCRTAKPVKVRYDQKEEYDPTKIYGLDDDPDQIEESNTLTDAPVDDILKWRVEDERPIDVHTLKGRFKPGYEPHPKRLEELTKWIANNCNHPIVAWWVGKNYINTQLLRLLLESVHSSKEMTKPARPLWNAILAAHSDERKYSWDFRWHSCCDRIKTEGWTNSVIRDFERATEPRYKIDSLSGINGTKPPSDDWQDGLVGKIANLDVVFPELFRKEITIPDEHLFEIVSILQVHLIKFSGMYEELGDRYFESPTCYPKSEEDGTYSTHNEKYFNWFLALFKQLIRIDPKRAKALISGWPNPNIYFDKLRLFSLNQKPLFSGHKAADIILDLDQSTIGFIDRECELLFLIRDRWGEFNPNQRNTIIDRIFSAAISDDNHQDEEDSDRQKYFAVHRIFWLIRNGCKISKAQSQRLNQLKTNLQDFHDNWEPKQGSNDLTICTSIIYDHTPDALIDLTIDQIIPQTIKATKHDFARSIEISPFEGLIDKDPRKAILALSYFSKREQTPEFLWRSLINNWSKTTDQRGLLSMCNLLRRLPTQDIIEIKHYIGSWLRDHFPSIFDKYPHIALEVFDHLISGICEGGAKATESSRGWSSDRSKSKRTIEFANGPIAKSVQGIIGSINNLNLKENATIPPKLTDRLEKLLTSPGEGSDHAVCQIARATSLLYRIDPKWTSQQVIPWFNLENPKAEPSWSGLLDSRVLSPQIWSIVKPHFLKLFPYIYKWHWDDDHYKRAYQFLVIVIQPSRTDLDLISFDAAMECIRSIDESGRQHIIYLLSTAGQTGEDGWNHLVIPIIENAWPKDLRFRTESSSKAWVSLLSETDNHFPVVLENVRRFLVPVSYKHDFLHRFSGDRRGTGTLTIKFPEQTLEMLNAVVSDDPQEAPHDLKQILEIIQETTPALETNPQFIRLTDIAERQ